MSKHITGELICECGYEVRWSKKHYANIMNGEKAEWRAEEGLVEVDKNNQVKCECGRRHNIK